MKVFWAHAEKAGRRIEFMQAVLFPFLLLTLLAWAAFPTAQFPKYLSLVLGSLCAVSVICSLVFWLLRLPCKLKPK